MSEATVKQGAVTSKDLAGGKHFRVQGLRGTFKDAVFGEDCTTQSPVSESTEKALKEMFGKGVQEVKAKDKSEAKDKPEGSGEGAGAQ